MTDGHEPGPTPPRARVRAMHRLEGLALSSPIAADYAAGGFEHGPGDSMLRAAVPEDHEETGWMRHTLAPAGGIGSRESSPPFDDIRPLSDRRSELPRARP